MRKADHTIYLTGGPQCRPEMRRADRAAIEAKIIDIQRRAAIELRWHTPEWSEHASLRALIETPVATILRELDELWTTPVASRRNRNWNAWSAEQDDED